MMLIGNEREFNYFSLETCWMNDSVKEDLSILTFFWLVQSIYIDNIYSDWVEKFLIWKNKPTNRSHTETIASSDYVMILRHNQESTVVSKFANVIYTHKDFKLTILIVQ